MLKHCHWTCTYDCFTYFFVLSADYIWQSDLHCMALIVGHDELSAEISVVRRYLSWKCITSCILPFQPHNVHCFSFFVLSVENGVDLAV